VPRSSSRSPSRYGSQANTINQAHHSRTHAFYAHTHSQIKTIPFKGNTMCVHRKTSPIARLQADGSDGLALLPGSRWPSRVRLRLTNDAGPQFHKNWPMKLASKSNIHWHYCPAQTPKIHWFVAWLSLKTTLAFGPKSITGSFAYSTRSKSLVLLHCSTQKYQWPYTRLRLHIINIFGHFPGSGSRRPRSESQVTPGACPPWVMVYGGLTVPIHRTSSLPAGNSPYGRA